MAPATTHATPPPATTERPTTSTRERETCESERESESPNTSRPPARRCTRNRLLACSTGLALVALTAQLALAGPLQLEGRAASSYNGDSAASASASSTGSLLAEEDANCARCYDRVKLAQSLIAVQEELNKKQRNLVRRKQLAAAASATSSSPSSSSAASASSHSHQPQNATGEPGALPTSRSVRSEPRTAEPASAADVEGAPSEPLKEPQQAAGKQPVIVWRLRVARSPADPPPRPAAYPGPAQSPAPHTPSHFKSNRDPALKQLKHKQQQQLAETCKALHELQLCLNETSAECVGDLKFHSLEVFSKQWIIRLGCPPANNPSFKPFGALIRSVSSVESRERVPIPRPISSEEETRARIEALLGGRTTSGHTPLGVMLRPTLSRSASQRFNLMSRGHQAGGLKGGSSWEAANQLLLVPCLVALLVALVTLGRLIRSELWGPEAAPNKGPTSEAPASTRDGAPATKKSHQCPSQQRDLIAHAELTQTERDQTV